MQRGLLRWQRAWRVPGLGGQRLLRLQTDGGWRLNDGNWRMTRRCTELCVGGGGGIRVLINKGGGGVT